MEAVFLCEVKVVTVGFLIPAAAAAETEDDTGLLVGAPPTPFGFDAAAPTPAAVYINYMELLLAVGARAEPPVNYPVTRF